MTDVDDRHPTDAHIAALVGGRQADHSIARHVAGCDDCSQRLRELGQQDLSSLAARRSRDGLGPVDLRPLPADIREKEDDAFTERENDILRRLASPASLWQLEREWPAAPAEFWRSLRTLREKVAREHHGLVDRAKIWAANQEQAAMDEPQAGEHVSATIDRTLGSEDSWTIDFRTPENLRGRLSITIRGGETEFRLRGIGPCSLVFDLPRRQEEVLLAQYGADAGIYRLTFCEDDLDWGYILPALLVNRRGLRLDVGQRVALPLPLTSIEPFSIRPAVDHAIHATGEVPRRAVDDFASAVDEIIPFELEGVVLRVAGSEDDGLAWTLSTEDPGRVGKAFEINARGTDGSTVALLVTVGPTPDHGVETSEWLPISGGTVTIREIRPARPEQSD